MVFDTTVAYKGQRYKKLKAECLKANKLFTDPEFPPRSRSLYFSRQAPADIVWKRPQDIVEKPEFFTEGASADDFTQGSIGNCWFVAACACIAEDHKLLKKVVPDIIEQGWTKREQYCGIFHFKFWQCGQWIDVVVDDFLPTRYGRLIYLHSKTRNEFWSALLEKAYAKLFGDYESLTAGKAKDGMVDMTGGVGESLEVEDFRSEEQKKRLFKILRSSYEDKSLMSASIRASGHEMEAEMACGLVKGHAYSVNAVKKIRLGKSLISVFNREKIRMIRCRNPWGGTEWKGAWSDGSQEWRQVSESEKKALGLTFDDNGEFWMSFEDFCRYFTSMDICHLINTSIFSLKKTWREGKAVSEWGRPHRCGGCLNNSTFLNNPQYIFDIKQPQDEIMVSLEQWDKRIDMDKGKANDTIGFTIMRADINRKYRMHDRLIKEHSGPFSNGRSVFARVPLTQGRYCAIPSTFEPGKTGKFVLRMYSTLDMELRELIYDKPRPPQCCGIQGFAKPKIAAMQITIVRGENLPPQDKDGAVDGYCIIYCEKKQETTRVIRDTVNPEWNERVTYYLKKPDEDITIEVWNSNMIKDEFVGQYVIPMAERNTFKGGNIIRRYELYGKGKESNQQRQGYLWLKLCYTEKMEDV